MLILTLQFAQLYCLLWRRARIYWR